MRAAVVTDFSLPPKLAEFAEPEPGPGEVLGDVLAASVSNLVRLIAARPHFLGAQRPPLVAGLDGVVRLPDGSTVYVPSVRSPWGTLAERVPVSSVTARTVPDGLDASQGAAVVNAASASWLPLTRIAQQGKPGTVLVLGATGASGSIAPAIAKELGAERVIAVGREGEKLRRTADHGADEVLPLDAELGAALPRVAGADGIDVVLDFLWGGAARVTIPAVAASAPSPAHHIDWVNIGALDGADIPVSAMLLRLSDIHIWGSGAGAYPASRLAEAADAALELAARGAVTVEIEDRALADLDATWTAPGRSVYRP